MAKDDVTDWDTTASNNTDIGGTSILGTANVSNFDGALRTLMAQIATAKMIIAGLETSYSDAEKLQALTNAGAIGIVEQAYTDAEKEQARTNTDAQAALGWKPVDLVTVTTAVSSIILPFPAGASSMRISGTAMFSTTTENLLARFSYDGGSTYLSGASDYVGSSTLAVTGSTLYGSNGSASSYITLATQSNDFSLPIQFNSQIDAGTSLYASIISTAAGFNAGTRDLLLTRGYSVTAGIPTHVQLIPDSSTFVAGTRILAEAF